MGDQTQGCSKALKSTRDDLVSLGSAVSSVISYLHQNPEKRNLDRSNLTPTDALLGSATYSPPDILGSIRGRLGKSRESLGELVSLSMVRDVFDECSTDKGYLHHYEEVYAPLFDLTVPSPKILEIGTGAPESGYAGSPGGSLRAWRQLYPDSSVYGVDIYRLDSGHLPSPPRRGSLRYICADQTSLPEMQRLAEELREECGSLDLIIDDGLHAPHAVIPTVLACAPLMHQTSFYVIEDVPPSLLETYLHIFDLCGLNMMWAPWKTSANNRPNSGASYPGKDDRAGCAIVGIQAS